MFTTINYQALNARQKETFNFQKVSAILADYGYATIKLNDDWQGADFIAQHIDGVTYLRVQLKSRLTFSTKYQGKNLHVCFPYQGHWYIYPHDELLTTFLTLYADTMAVSPSWLSGEYTFPKISVANLAVLAAYRL